ncbi:hypothetical protein B0O99DRAFT_685619 [Bisporella sp. PMI_857]|nr:hypothetical protein B0O99DRAFT_685619 [Bisporella sp. PMI_857]
MKGWGNPDDIDYIVVTDSEEILSVGDQGVGGILISIAKLVLTTICAGIHPNRQLVVVLDCGTDNEDLLNDELYLGIRKRRTGGKEYDGFVDTFVKSARELYPKAYIHFEDFELPNGEPRNSCFNNGVQGTGCVTLAAIMAGLHVSKLKLQDMRMAVFGSGSNPTRLHEAYPSDINEWSKGKALIATGSPFPPVKYNAQSPALRDPNQGLLPDVEDVRDISVQIAKAVIHAAVEEGLAHFFKRKIGIPDDEGGLDEWVREQMWDPVYRDLELVEGKKEKEDLKEESGIKGDDAQATS